MLSSCRYPCNVFQNGIHYTCKPPCRRHFLVFVSPLCSTLPVSLVLSSCPDSLDSESRLEPILPAFLRLCRVIVPPSWACAALLCWGGDNPCRAPCNKGHVLRTRTSDFPARDAWNKRRFHFRWRGARTRLLRACGQCMPGNGDNVLIEITRTFTTIMTWGRWGRTFL
jgi:hypothetical protein